MKEIIKQNIELLNRKIEEVNSQSWKSVDQKYFEICAYYATVMTVLTKHSDVYTLKDLEPLAKIFGKYQNNYFDDVLN